MVDYVLCYVHVLILICVFVLYIKNECIFYIIYYTVDSFK